MFEGEVEDWEVGGLVKGLMVVSGGFGVGVFWDLICSSGFEGRG